MFMTSFQIEKEFVRERNWHWKIALLSDFAADSWHEWIQKDRKKYR
jgi:hypothetical protein